MPVSMTQREIIASLPSHLQPFVAEQDHAAQYTARDHAVWRFLMRRLRAQLAKTAHPVYLEGLARTGISTDHIPSIDEMNQCLQQLGWQAVVVDGFIPPAIFMEFQARRILVIALDMRSLEHMLYTPAPDIVHESAGHAPFLIDIDYAEFLQRFGEVGMRAIANQHDHALYEAVRRLSIIKESPDASAQEIEDAETHLNQLAAMDVEPSEAALLTRLHWWTVEYGLVGSVDDYRLFGAGLLSSLGESRHCLDDRLVKKIPLTVDAVNQPYDITTEQPQLFVTPSCRHLSQVLEEFAAGMAWQQGGAVALEKAIAAGTVCTARLDSGLQIAGRFVKVMHNAVGTPIFLRTEGPTQLAHGDRELVGHDIRHHPHGFSSPLGGVKEFTRSLSDYSVDELASLGVTIGKPVKLEFLSGITVIGRLDRILRENHRNLILSFSDCTVTTLGGDVLFDPSWGVFDMAVGTEVVSVAGGAADKTRYPLFDAPSETKSATTVSDTALMSAYDEIAQITASNLPEREAAWREYLARWPEEWLLREEMLQALKACGRADSPLAEQLTEELETLLGDPEHAELLSVVTQPNGS
jgi:phenylalanine-4-hydroxylase